MGLRASKSTLCLAIALIFVSHSGAADGEGNFSRLMPLDRNCGEWLNAPGIPREPEFTCSLPDYKGTCESIIRRVCQQAKEFCAQIKPYTSPEAARKKGEDLYVALMKSGDQKEANRQRAYYREIARLSAKHGVTCARNEWRFEMRATKVDCEVSSPLTKKGSDSVGAALDVVKAYSGGSTTKFGSSGRGAPTCALKENDSLKALLKPLGNSGLCGPVPLSRLHAAGSSSLNKNPSDLWNACLAGKIHSFPMGWEPLSQTGAAIEWPSTPPISNDAAWSQQVFVPCAALEGPCPLPMGTRATGLDADVRLEAINALLGKYVSEGIFNPVDGTGARVDWTASEYAKLAAGPIGMLWYTDQNQVCAPQAEKTFEAFARKQSETARANRLVTGSETVNRWLDILAEKALYKGARCTRIGKEKVVEGCQNGNYGELMSIYEFLSGREHMTAKGLAEANGGGTLCVNLYPSADGTCRIEQSTMRAAWDSSNRPSFKVSECAPRTEELSFVINDPPSGSQTLDASGAVTVPCDSLRQENGKYCLNAFPIHPKINAAAAVKLARGDLGEDVVLTSSTEDYDALSNIGTGVERTARNLSGTGTLFYLINQSGKKFFEYDPKLGRTTVKVPRSFVASNCSDPDKVFEMVDEMQGIASSVELTTTMAGGIAVGMGIGAIAGESAALANMAYNTWQFGGMICNPDSNRCMGPGQAAGGFAALAFASWAGMKSMKFPVNAADESELISLGLGSAASSPKVAVMRDTIIPWYASKTTTIAGMMALPCAAEFTYGWYESRGGLSNAPKSSDVLSSHTPSCSTEGILMSMVFIGGTEGMIRLASKLGKTLSQLKDELASTMQSTKGSKKDAFNKFAQKYMKRLSRSDQEEIANHFAKSSWPNAGTDELLQAKKAGNLGKAKKIERALKVCR